VVSEAVSVVVEATSGSQWRKLRSRRQLLLGGWSAEA